MQGYEWKPRWNLKPTGLRNQRLRSWLQNGLFPIASRQNDFTKETGAVLGANSDEIQAILPIVVARPAR